jgi:hypothetical protein
LNKCVENGRPTKDCYCVYASLGELPPAYRDEAIVWATQTSFQAWKNYAEKKTVSSARDIFDGAANGRTLASIAAEFVSKVFPSRIFPRLVPYVGWAVGADEAGTIIDDSISGDRKVAAEVYIGNGCGSSMDRVVDYYNSLKRTWLPK